MADADTVRLVTIEDWDVAACGGTHVPNTRERGAETVRGGWARGGALPRVESPGGSAGTERGARPPRGARGAAGELAASPAALADAAADLRATKADLEAEVADLTDRLLDAALADLSTAERDGHTWRGGTVEGLALIHI